MKDKILKKLKRFLELLVFYFNKNERNKIKFREKAKSYQEMEKIDLEFEFEKSQAKVNWNEDVYKIISGIMKALAGITFLGVIVKGISIFVPNSLQTQALSDAEINFAMIIAIIFGLIMLSSCLLGLIGYRKYINELKTELNMIEKVLRSYENE